MTGRKVFPVGATLSAADLNGYLMDQVPAIFANAAQRQVAWPAPPDGAASFLLDSRRQENWEASGLGQWVCRRALGVVGRVATSTLFTAGSAAAEYGVSSLQLSLGLWTGRTYRATFQTVANAGVAGQRIPINIRGKRSSGPAATDTAVGDWLQSLAAAGTNGRSAVLAIGEFAVATDDSYVLAPFVVNTTATTPPSLVGNTRGLLQLIVEDVGPQTAETPALPLLA